MNMMMSRVKNILLAPKSEWPVVAAETATTKGLYMPYVLVLAAIPAVAGFIKGSLIGYSAFGIHVRTPIGAGLGSMILGYVLSLAVLYLVALVIDALAPTFGGQKNRVQALKTACYAWTAAWIAGVATLIPWIGWLIVIAGGVYSIYLLYLGLPHTMKCPREKAGGYTAVSVIIAVVLAWIMAMIVALVVGAGGASAIQPGSSSASVSFDEDSRMGQIMAMAKRMETAGNKAELAQANDDPQAQAEAMQAMVAAMAGSKNGKPVEALSPDQLKALLPETLGDLKRTRISAERQAGMGVQITNAEATYVNGDGSRTVRVSLADMPVMSGMMAFASAFATESSSQNQDGYEKTYVRDHQRIHEKWNETRKRGEYGLRFGGRFQVTVEGDANSMDDLKMLAAQLDMERLQSLAEG